MVGHPVSCVFFVQGGENTVADRTAGEWRGCRDRRERGQDLPELDVDLIAGNEEMALRERTGSKPRIARQNDPVLFEGKANDIIVGQGRVIEHVMPQQAEALCELSQHGIGDKSHGT